jgi:hypothetical protein
MCLWSNVVLFGVNFSQGQQSPYDNLARYKLTPNFLSTKPQNSTPLQIQAFVYLLHVICQIEPEIPEIQLN